MADRIAFQFELKQAGLPQLINKLKDFPDKFQQKVVRRAARRGMNIVRDAARAKARAMDDPASAEKIYKNIVTNESGRKGRAIGGIVMKVGVRGGALAYPLTGYTHGRGPAFPSRRKYKRPPGPHPGGNTQYWRHLEFGTRKMRARTFMLPALMNNAQAVADKIVDEINKGLDNFVGPVRPL